jgi:N-acetylated-alpha-linked acidic dipeptidase
MYITQIKELDTTQRAHAKELDAEIEEGVYQALADPKKKMVPPVKEPIPPYLNFAPLDNAADDLTRAAEAYEKAFSSAPMQGSAALDAKLMKTERLLTNAEGLPNRPWFQNLIYAPGFYTGYGVKTIPGVREAIEQKRWTEADQQIVRVAKALQDEADLLDEATKDLGSH